MLKISQTVIKCLKYGNKQASSVGFINFSSTATVVETKHAQGGAFEDGPESPKTPPKAKPQSTNSMVTAVFASLQSQNVDEAIKTPHTDDKIGKAATVDELLALSEGNGVSRRHALKVVSVLANWSSTGKVALSDFETDSRFVRLCKTLTRGTKSSRISASKSDDLSTILSVTADDEAAKLVASITLPQMVKVMSTLSQKNRRSTLLLRALSYNITASCERLDLKQCADVLYSMAVLNFVDDNLLVKVTSDVCDGLEKDINKSAVVGSITTSLGLLRYKNPEVLDVLSDWVLKKHTICRPQDIFSFFMTLAVLDYTPTNSDRVFEVLIPQMTYSEARNPFVWLDVIWSLVLLERASHEQVASVLDQQFVNQIEGNVSVSTSAKLKLLNIDGAAAHLLKGYKGGRLSPSSSIRNVNMARNKEKAEMVEAVVDSLRNLIQSSKYLRTNINTGLGFYIDAECRLDKKCNPLPLEKKEDTADTARLAILAYDYHDMCRGKIEPTGINAFASRILEARGYKILAVPYTEFQTSLKLVQRVKYLEKKIKEVATCL